jgi:hypothetical protein
MSLLITITDGGNSQTDIRCGINPRTAIKRVIAAGQIQFWDDQRLVLSGSPNTGFKSIQDWPFTPRGGGRRLSVRYG